MRIAFALMAAGAFFISGCETTKSASTDQHEIFVKIDSTTSDNDLDGAEGHINIIIERDDEEPIHIEGDPASAEVQEQLALLKAEGIHVMDGGSHLSHMESDGKKHKWIMKHGDEHDHGDSVEIDEFVTAEGKHVVIRKNGKIESVNGEDFPIDLDVTTSEDGKHIIIKKDGKTETFVIPDMAENKRVFIMKGDEHKKHKGAHKEVIVIKGSNEEEVRNKLKEHGIELEFEFDDELEDEKVEK